MATSYIIPLQPGSQTIDTTLNGEVVTITITWRGDAYYMDITNANGDAIQGLRLVTGCNLLGQFEYMGYTTPLILVGEPTYDNLGTYSVLVSYE